MKSLKYSIEFLVEIRWIDDRQTIAQWLNISKNLVIPPKAAATLALFPHQFHEVVNHPNPVVEKRYGRILSIKMIAYHRLHKRAATRMFGNVVDSDALGLLSGKRILEFNEKHGHLTVDYVNDWLVYTNWQICVLSERIELEEHRTLVECANLLV